MTTSTANEEVQRRGSPPPSYEEAMDDRPPPLYTEHPSEESTVTSQIQPSSQRTARVHPENTILIQPGHVFDRQRRRTETNSNSRGEWSVTEQHRKKRLTCNCFCSALHWTPCSCDYELFCFICLGFISYLLLCAPWVYLCLSCKKLCPGSYGECFTRNTNMMESYEDRDENIASHICWSCLGPCCCLSCDGDTEVLPCSDPCVKHCGVRSVLKKVACYCGSYKMCDYTLNAMDEQAFGFICDCKEIGCHFGPGI